MRRLRLPKITTLRVINAAQYKLYQSSVPRHALYIINRLNKTGHQGMIVGGYVRDTILGLTHKDCDIVTDATPREITALFGNRAQIIGQRFPTVHVKISGRLIEVSTFRGDTAVVKFRHSTKRKQLSLTTRVQYGTQAELDVRHRDLTINSLYYDPITHLIFDYVGGLNDLLDAQKIRSVQSASQLLKTDPARILRVLRTQAKLRFNFEPKLAIACKTYGSLLKQITRTRLSLEFKKSMLNGNSLENYRLLQHFGLLDVLFPNRANQYRYSEKLIYQTLRQNDQYAAEGKHAEIYSIYAALFWPTLLHNLTQKGLATLKFDSCPSNLHTNSEHVLDRQMSRLSSDCQEQAGIKKIWEMQWLLAKHRRKNPKVVANRREFSAAHNFLLAREAAGEITDNLGLWWMQYQNSEGQKNKTFNRFNTLRTNYFE